MKIGVIHNYYRSEIPSGENLTVDQILTILQEAGHSVSLYSESSDRYKNKLYLQIYTTLRLFFPIPNKRFCKWLFEQDAIQIHNNFPLLGRYEMRKILQSNIPLTRVIHNYRKSCLSGNHFMNKTLCQKCTIHKRNKGIWNKCYQKSFWKSLIVEKYTKIANIYESASSCEYIAISDVVRRYLIKIGVEPTKIVVIPNCINALEQIHRSAQDILLVSRLEPEKGVLLAIQTWEEYPDLPKLHVIGTGSLDSYVRESSKKLSNLEFHGFQNTIEIEKVASNCRTLLAPGLWEEPFGRTLVEALSRGQSIVAPKMGLAPHIIREEVNGFFCDNSSESLRRAIILSQKLDFDSQVEFSTSKWQILFSPSVVLRFWKRYYDEKETRCV